MNKVILMGRLTKDPDVRYTQNQKVVAQFTMAVDRPYLNQDGKREADFLPVVIWGKAAELVGNSLAKGHRVLVEGRIQTRNYDDQNGTRHYVTEIIAANFEFIEKKASGNNGGGASAHSEAAAAESPMAGLGTDVPFDEEIPF